MLTLKAQKEIGVWNYVCLEAGLEAGSLRLFTTLLGWTTEEVQVFVAHVRAEMKAIKRNQVHAQYT